jgi:PEP-CTERM motif
MVCLWGREVKADTVNFTATEAPLSGNLTIDLQALLTVTPVTGTFFDPGQAVFTTRTVYEMTAITGTLNGYPITFFQDPLGAGSWLNLNLTLGAFYFSADGSEAWLENDVDYSLIAIVPNEGAGGSGFGGSTPINYHANLVSTPEPPTVGLLLLGIGSAFALRRRIGQVSCSAA